MPRWKRDQYVDASGAWRRPDEDYIDYSGSWRSPDDDYVDFSGQWRGANDMYIDETGYWRRPGERYMVIPATGGGDLHSCNASHLIALHTKYPKGINRTQRIFFAQDGSTEWKH